MRIFCNLVKTPRKNTCTPPSASFSSSSSYHFVNCFGGQQNCHGITSTVKSVGKVTMLWYYCLQDFNTWGMAFTKPLSKGFLGYWAKNLNHQPSRKVLEWIGVFFAYRVLRFRYALWYFQRFLMQRLWWQCCRNIPWNHMYGNLCSSVTWSRRIMSPITIYIYNFII